MMTMYLKTGVVKNVLLNVVSLSPSKLKESNLNDVLFLSESQLSL